MPFCTCSGTNPPECPSEYPLCIEDPLGDRGDVGTCEPACDPTEGEDACPFTGQACYYVENEERFRCAPDASGPDSGEYGSSCEFVNACDPGLNCAPAAAVPGCYSGNCCTPFCDLSEPAASQSCPGFSGGQECVPYFTPGFEPEGYEHVGFCSVP